MTVLIRPGTSQYIIPPNVPVRSFDDLERWLIEFCKKFELVADQNPGVMRFQKRMAPVPAAAAKDAARPTYEIEGVNVQTWSTIEDARSFFAIFAPTCIPVGVLQVRTLLTHGQLCPGTCRHCLDRQQATEEPLSDKLFRQGRHGTFPRQNSFKLLIREPWGSVHR